MSTLESNAFTPVFPLNIPLFPGCKLALQIFEQRYLNMVSECLRTQSPFIIALLKEGFERQEVIDTSQPIAKDTVFYSTGTLASIVDFGQRPNGLLSLILQGDSLQQLSEPRQSSDGLWLAKAKSIAETGQAQAKAPTTWLQLLETLKASGAVPWLDEEASIPSEHCLNYLAMYLPFSNWDKYTLLNQTDIADRWQYLNQLLEIV